MRTSWDLTESPLSTSIRDATAKLYDLTLSNPTMCGFTYDLAPLPAPLLYDPDPKGIISARAAVSDYYHSHEARVPVEDLVLTTSTSEAYSFLFRLLCNPQDEVLVAQPSYPLFEYLATLDDVRLRTYPLFHDFGWWIDFAQLERSITPLTRAILVVHPNNPTGHATYMVERHALESLCARYQIALIVDEVFLDYALDPTEHPVRSFATGDHPCLTFIVSGLSKIAALPQMKVGWLAVMGPETIRSEALARLEVIADTFLSMNSPIQHALPRLLMGRQAVQRQIMNRIQHNLGALLSEAHKLTYHPVQAGWTVILQVPQMLGSDDLAERLIREAGVITHPAAFYSMAGPHRLVASLIVPSDTFTAAIVALERWCLSSSVEAEGLAERIPK